MRTILSRYIAMTVIKATALALLIVGSVLMLMIALGELKNIGEGDYGITQVIFYIAMRLPNQLYQFSPLLMLIGSIMGLSALSTHRELTVMRVYGFSLGRIIYSVLTIAFIVILAVSFIGEWVGPTLSKKAELRKENAQNAGQAVVTATGRWWHVDHNFIYIERVIDRQRLEGVTRYQYDDQHRLVAAYYAKVLAYENRQWQMQDVVKTMFYKDRTKSESYSKADWNLKLNANLLNTGLIDPSEMSLPRLLQYARYREKNGLQASEYQFDFWRRLFQPFASLVMIFLAIPFVLGAFQIKTLGFRIMMGVMVGFAFFILNATLSQLCVVFQLSPIFAASLPLLFFAIIGIILYRRLNIF